MENTFKELTGKVPPPNALGYTSPLNLCIDDRLSFVKSEISLDGIRFEQDNAFGQELWRIANPIPWSRKSRWITWTTYALGGLYVGLALFWVSHRERVPITGWRQFRCVSIEGPGPKEPSKPVNIDPSLKALLLPDDDPRIPRSQSILKRVLSAAGLDHLQWFLLVMNTPG